MVERDDLEIKHATFVRAGADQVYNAFSSAEGLDAWFTNGAEINPRPGGEILFRWRDWGPERVTGEDGGPVLEAVPLKRFVFQWHPEDESYATTVEIDFTQMARAPLYADGNMDILMHQPAGAADSIVRLVGAKR